jgi:MEDS: MEthanogen/methylotroph, DcmR Sensory domain
MENSSSAVAYDFTKIFPEGMHLCYIFNDDEERVKTMAKFLASSLATGQKVLSIVDTVSPHDLQKELKALGVDLSATGGDIVTVDNESAYCPGGTFDPDALLDGAISFCKKAHSDGYTGSRICGDMSWVLRKNVSLTDLLAYESKVNTIIKIPPCTAAICEYDARKFDGATIMDILRIHPAMIVRGQVVKNPYFTPADELLAQRKNRQL